ncbi:hypothetical protein D3C76_1273790 [compost metagenome]
MLDQQLGGNEYGNGHRAAQRQGDPVPERAGQCVGDVGDEHAHEGRGPQQAGGHRDQGRDQGQLQAHAASIIHAQGNRLVAPQRQHIEGGQRPHEHGAQHRDH